MTSLIQTYLRSEFKIIYVTENMKFRLNFHIKLVSSKNIDI